MGTISPDDAIGSVLFGKNRRAVLGLLYTHPDQSFYLRQIVRAAGGGMGAVQRELQELTRAGIVRRSVRDKQVYFQANSDCPVFAELKALVIKTIGVADVLRAALTPLADRIRLAMIYGSVAHGEPRRGSDVDLIVVGEVSFADVAACLSSAETSLRREVNPAVYPPREFRSKLLARHHFLSSVVKGEKIILIGDERELARLAAKRMVDGASEQPRRNRRSVSRHRS
jgi:uncharacterized protein